MSVSTKLDLPGEVDRLLAQLGVNRSRTRDGALKVHTPITGEIIGQVQATSANEAAAAIEAAQKANCIVYVLLIADRGFYGRGVYTMGYSGDMQMRKMAEETGGRVIDVGNNGKKMEAAFSQIEEELRTQYVASYTPTNDKLDGSYRKIDVECKGDGLKVQSRKGYYAIQPTD